MRSWQRLGVKRFGQRLLPRERTLRTVTGKESGEHHSAGGLGSCNKANINELLKLSSHAKEPKMLTGFTKRYVTGSYGAGTYDADNKGYR